MPGGWPSIAEWRERAREERERSSVRRVAGVGAEFSRALLEREKGQWGRGFPNRWSHVRLVSGAPKDFARLAALSYCKL